MAFESRLRHQNLQLQYKNDSLYERIEELESQVKNQNEKIFELKSKLKEESQKLQSFKDPEGCTDLRVILQDFEHNIKNLHKEKEIQYKNMRLSLRLLETMEQDRKTKFWTEEERRQQRNKTIATLRKT